MVRTPLRRTRRALLLTTALLLPAAVAGARAPAGSTDAEALRIVNCSLPGQLRQLGNRTTYLSARRPVRTTALECRVRGGEYVARDEASLGSALKVWLGRARDGDPVAQTTVGEIFEAGLGTAPDPESAAQWYERAAKQGSPRAMVALGNLYERGEGVAQDPERALTWYRRASGLPEAIALEPVPDLAPLEATLAAERERLNRRQATLVAENEHLKQQLAASETELAQSQAASTEDLSAVQSAAEREQARLKARLQETQQQLARARRDLEALAAEASAAETAATTATARGLVKVLVPSTDTNVAAPEIRLIQPDVGTTTRGLVKVRAPSTARGSASAPIIGRVLAPAGLLSLTLNGEALSTNSAGVFQLPAPQTTATRLAFAAIDALGQRTDLTLNLSAEGPTRAPLPKVDLGNYHALLIANERYSSLPPLKTPKADVSRIETALRERYGFRTQVLQDVTRYEILSALNELRATLTNRDNLLIYYAGHGELDRTNMRGYWLPVDAELESTANWLSNADITDILNVMNARHVMLVVDSCYSGTLTRSGLLRLEGGRTLEEQTTWLKLLASKRARMVLSSGGLAPVLDFGGGAHSVFARAFVETLESNAEVLAGRALHQAVAARVAHAAANYDFEQIPEYAPIRRAGHEAGDFVLLPRR